MANSTNAQKSLDLANAAGNLEQALVVGTSGTGKVELFLAEGDQATMLVLLVRAQDAIIRNLNQ